MNKWARGSEQGGAQAATDRVFIRGSALRKRWGDMPNSTFYDRLKKGLIPEPEYPFGPTTPYWRLDVIEDHEQVARKVAA